jgi:hypothetical protein
MITSFSATFLFVYMFDINDNFQQRRCVDLS